MKRKKPLKRKKPMRRKSAKVVSMFPVETASGNPSMPELELAKRDMAIVEFMSTHYFHSNRKQDPEPESQKPEPTPETPMEEAKSPAFQLKGRVRVIAPGKCDSGCIGRIYDMKNAIWIRIEEGPEKEIGRCYAHSNDDDLELIVEAPTEQSPIDEPQPVA
jgi:hypothetical protein